MILEMLLLVLIALAAFAYVLAPIVLPSRNNVETDEAIAEHEEDVSESAVVEKLPVHDLS